MSPTALALAILLHVLVATALWWLSLQKLPVPPVEEAINVSFEEPKPPEPAKPQEPPAQQPPPPQPAPKPPVVQQTPPPPIDAVPPPPAPITADKRTQAPPADQVSKEPPAPAPAPERKELTDLPQPEASPPPPAPPVEARVQPPPPAPPAPAVKPIEEPPTDNGLKKVEPTSPPPPATQATPVPQPQPKPADPTPTPKPMPQQQQALATPTRPPAPAPKPELRPSPLSTTPNRRPPSASSQEAPSQHTFVNPADAYSRAKVGDNYRWQVLSKIVGYRYESTRTTARQGVTVVQIVIARDGRLLSATVVRSSGEPEFDNGVLAGVRAGAPYTPLPPEIKGASAAFDFPLVSIRR